MGRCTRRQDRGIEVTLASECQHEGVERRAEAILLHWVLRYLIVIVYGI